MEFAGNKMKVGDLVRYKEYHLTDDQPWQGPGFLLSYDKLMKVVVVLTKEGKKVRYSAKLVQKLGKGGILKCGFGI